MAWSSTSDAAALKEAIRLFYEAPRAEDLEFAVQRALAVAPNSAEALSIAAHLARYKSDEVGEFEYLEAALVDRENPFAEYHLDWFNKLPLNATRVKRRAGLLRLLSQQHPSSLIRNQAGANLSSLERLRQGVVVPNAGLESLDLALVGAWDNEQGKGFGEVLPPEEELLSGKMDLSKRYLGAVVEVGWRVAPPKTAAGNYDLESLFSPNNWAVAYGAAVVSVPQAGTYMLQIRTTDPIKVWVNGHLTFSARDLSCGWVGPALRLPTKLRSGPNHLVIKSAQEDAGWGLRVSVSTPEGASVKGLKQLPPHTEVAVSEQTSDGEVPGLEQIVSTFATGAEGLEARDHADISRWASLLGADQLSVKSAEGYLEKYPESLTARIILLDALVGRKDTGRVTDLLSELDAANSGGFHYLRFLQATLWLRQGFSRKARVSLQSLLPQNADLPQLWREFARYFRSEGWTEDRCDALRKAIKYAPGHLDTQLRLGDCLQATGFRSEARAVVAEARIEFAGHSGALRRARSLATNYMELDRAVELVQIRLRLRPDSYEDWIRLASLFRKSHQPREARKALERALEVDPDAVGAYAAMGRLSYEEGAREDAIAWWKRASQRDPDNERLALRLSYLQPAEEEPWLADVADDTRIAAALELSGAGEAKAGADVVVLLNQEVTAAHADGSRSGVVTRVIEISNERGRDNVTSLSLYPGGRKRMMQSYALNPGGTRVEASGLRDNIIRFRGLEVGGIVVLQYRYDGGADPYLAQHYARTLPFQGPGIFTRVAEWILWLSKDDIVHQSVHGPVAYVESVSDGMRRLAWSARDLPPVIPEGNMPPLLDVVSRVVVSTVPSWDIFLEWEASLLREVFEESSAIKLLARKIMPDGISAQEKVLRLHRYVQEEIRYEQDYENSIAGVKPHAAPVVFARRYGDCKDKTVLFMALAKLGGVKAQFAILRTTGKGAVNKDIPMQQFNHAIVYIPPQPGIAAGQFYDPTADALDLHVVRTDDVGAWALVYDSDDNSSQWIQVPIPERDDHQLAIRLKLQLSADGSADGILNMKGAGVSGAAIRRFARNPKILDKFIGSVTGRIFPGATTGKYEIIEATNLREPARISWEFSAPNIAQKKGKNLVWKAPIDSIGRTSSAFSLPSRVYVLRLGVPRMEELSVEVTAPPGWKLRKSPGNDERAIRCFSMTRSVQKTSRSTVLTFVRELKCDEISPEDYEGHRNMAEEIDRLFEPEVVFGR